MSVRISRASGLARARNIQSVRARLERRASPRMHMLVLVTLTGACGFLSSYALLHAGMRSMTLRYPLAVGIAYLAFLGLVALWLRRFRLRASVRRRDDGMDVDLDVLDVPLGDLWSSHAPVEPDFGGGGGFSGGGGGASWGDGPTKLASMTHASASHGASAVGDSAGSALDIDIGEGALWLIPVAIILAVALGVIAYVVYLAPALFAELLLDAGLAAGLYKRLMQKERRYWLATAIRSTVLPACFVAALLAFAGNIMHSVYPDATSIGMVAKHLRERPKHATPP